MRADPGLEHTIVSSDGKLNTISSRCIAGLITISIFDVYHSNMKCYSSQVLSGEDLAASPTEVVSAEEEVSGSLCCSVSM